MEVLTRRDQNNSFGLQLIFIIKILFCFVLVSYPKSVQAYKNYTVGDSFGWYDNTEKSDVDYQKWANGKNFSLGDFLIFNTDTNHSVIQTYNATTYKLCDYSDAGDSDTVQWSAANPSNTATQPVTVNVPLLKEGPTFFFSGDYDGDQCSSGQHFSISVAHGQGLPKSLRGDDGDNSSPGPAEGPQSGDDDDESTPVSNVPANFDHPKKTRESDGGDDQKRSDSSSGVTWTTVEFSRILLSVVLLGFVWMF